MLEFLSGDLVSNYTLEVLRGAYRAAHDAETEVVVESALVESREPLRPGRPWLQSLARAGRIGLLVVAADLPPDLIIDAAATRLPVVMIDPVNLRDPGVPSVGATNFQGGFAAGEHLLGLGHRRVGVIQGPEAVMGSTARIHGFRAAFEQAGSPIEPSAIRTADFTYEDGLREGLALLARPEPPTAIFASSDTQALGVLEAARQAGAAVPERLSVVGFDSTILAAMSTPPLTAVRQPLEEMGAVAVRTLLRLARGELLDSQHVELATELIVRASTAPAATPQSPGLG
jgi:LacI family transcriptional regulator